MLNFTSLLSYSMLFGAGSYTGCLLFEKYSGVSKIISKNHKVYWFCTGQIKKRTVSNLSSENSIPFNESRVWLVFTTMVRTTVCNGFIFYKAHSALVEETIDYLNLRLRHSVLYSYMQCKTTVTEHISRLNDWFVFFHVLPMNPGADLIIFNIVFENLVLSYAVGLSPNRAYIPAVRQVCFVEQVCYALYLSKLVS